MRKQKNLVTPCRIFVRYSIYPLIFIHILSISGCSDEVEPPTFEDKAIREEFGGRIDIHNLPNYANQPVPDYIKGDNGKDNPITDEGATLGRVLFYDKKLSVDNTLCASCHQQALAFSDSAVVSRGVQGGVTERHSMRLINARFNYEKKFFWDERAETLEDQTTMPMKDHAELGFSGQQGRPDFQDLLSKLQAVDYYNELFTLVYGDSLITEDRLQRALAQFVRSIQSFDSKYDEGYKQDFSNFTESEKRGMELFTILPQAPGGYRNGGGLGCFICHRPPAFDIKPDAGNNGIIGVANKPGEIDITNTKAPTLRDIANPNGQLNGPLMHDGSVTTFAELILAVESQPFNPNRDTIMGQGTFNLHISEQEAEDLVAFLKTLSGKNVYTDERWSNPFQE